MTRGLDHSGAGENGGAMTATMDQPIAHSPSGWDPSAPILYLHAMARERLAVRERLVRLGAPVIAAADLADAMRALTDRRFVLCLADLADDRAALTAVRILRAMHPMLPVVGVIDPSNPIVAAEAVHAGVFDLLPWPFDERDLETMLANTHERGAVDPRLGPAAPHGNLFVQSAAMRQVLEQVRAAAGVRRGVLVCGEPGSGRELVARAIHASGGGPSDRFIRVDCHDTAPSELEDVLFGAGERRDASRPAGVDWLATDSATYRSHGGTLFLANLIEAPARVQTRLSKLLRDRESLVGDRAEIADLDLRPIVAVEPDIDAAVADGRIRRDLAERLSHTRIDVPSLRNRREDIPLLAVSFLKRIADRQGAPAKGLSRSVLALLSALPWHANARELRELLETLNRSVNRPVIQLDDVLEHARLDGVSARIDPGVSLREAKARFERECISAVLIRHHGRVGEAAKALGIQRTNLYRKVRQLNVARSLLSARK